MANYSNRRASRAAAQAAAEAKFDAIERELGIGVPEVVGRQFDDASDSRDSQERLNTLGPGVPLLSHSQPPFLLRPRAIYFPDRSSSRGVGPPRMVRTGPVFPSSRRSPPLSPSTKRLYTVSIRKELQQRAQRRRDLFNVLAVPFSRRARFCVKRKIRREVLFAFRSSKRINQRSPGGSGGYRRTQSSLWRC